METSPVCRCGALLNPEYTLERKGGLLATLDGDVACEQVWRVIESRIHAGGEEGRFMVKLSPPKRA